MFVAWHPTRCWDWCLLKDKKMLFDNVSNIVGYCNNSTKKCLSYNLIFAVLGDVCPHKLDKQFTNICFNILAIWCVERHNFSVSVSSRVLSITFFDKYFFLNNLFTQKTKTQKT